MALTISAANLPPMPVPMSNSSNNIPVKTGPTSSGALKPIHHASNSDFDDDAEDEEMDFDKLDGREDDDEEQDDDETEEEEMSVTPEPAPRKGGRKGRTSKTSQRAAAMLLANAQNGGGMAGQSNPAVGSKRKRPPTRIRTMTMEHQHPNEGNGGNSGNIHPHLANAPGSAGGNGTPASPAIVSPRSARAGSGSNSGNNGGAGNGNGMNIPGLPQQTDMSGLPATSASSSAAVGTFGNYNQHYPAFNPFPRYAPTGASTRSAAAQPQQAMNNAQFDFSFVTEGPADGYTGKGMRSAVRILLVMPDKVY